MTTATSYLNWPSGGRLLRERSREPLLPERLLARLWRAKTGGMLRTTDGRKLRVVYPGRPAPGHGPDFRDAVLELDGQRITGPVELHRTPADWHAHGHHLDPAYDSVVLHVVSASGHTTPPSRRADSKGLDVPPAELKTPDASVKRPTLPTVELAWVEEPNASIPTPSSFARLTKLDEPSFHRTLRRAGRTRFEMRVRQLERLIGNRGADQALFAALMDGLGYAENRGPFGELAARLPFVLLRAAALTAPPERRRGLLLGLLLAGSGLDPVTSEWAAFVGTEAIRPSVWCTAGVRPSNHPRRRVQAVAAYVLQATPNGLAGWLADLAALDVSAMVEALKVPSPSGPALVGEARSREMVVNAVLPGLTAWARQQGDVALSQRLTSAYQTLPSLPDNTIVREALRLLGRGGTACSGACEQQGLMHLYRQSIAA